jgi:Tol biopolymer transport system component
MPDRPPNILDSWKEIAAFLGRDKRTAMRWAENHAMPIHRYPGSKHARVFAYRSELTIWLESFAHTELEQGGENGSQPTTSQEVHLIQPELAVIVEAETFGTAPSERELGPSLHPRFDSPCPQTVEAIGSPEIRERNRGDDAFVAALWRRRWSVAAAAATLVCALGVAAALRPVARLAASSKAAGLVQLTNDGRAKTGLGTDGTTLFIEEMAGHNRVLASMAIGGGALHPIPAPFANASLADVSQDGKSLLVLSREGLELAPQLWKLAAQGGTPTRIGQVHCSWARWSPDGNQIAFTAGNQIYLTDTEGRESHLIAAFDAMPGNLIWSPDGHRLRFVLLDQKTGTSSGWELDSRGAKWFDGSVPKQLSLNSPCCAGWTWTGDGKGFAYIVRQSIDDFPFDLGDQRVFLSGLLGIQRELSINLGRVVSLASARDGSRLYFLISQGDRGELLRFSKKEATFESYLPGLSAQDLSFSHDGEWLSYFLSQDRSLWRSKSDGTQALRLVAPPMEVELPSWSPDGRQIAFMGRSPGKPWRIYLVGRDGGSPREAAAGDDTQGAPTWSPDGKTIAYARTNCDEDNSCGIFLLDLETGRIQPLPASETLRTARWSPDGKYIAALKRDARSVHLFDLKQRRWHKLADDLAGDDISWSSDSKALYVSCFLLERPSIDKVRISDHSRSTVVDLTPLQKMPGRLAMWFGLAPDDSPVVLHLYTSSEVYSLDTSRQ